VNRIKTDPVRTIAQLVFAAAFGGIALFFVISSASCLNAPFLAGPGREAERAIFLFWFRAVVSGFALCLLLILRKRLLRRKPEKTHFKDQP
jgi:hypothetical protein